MTPDELLARVLYRDGLVLIIDKPAGLPVHPGPGGGPNLEALFEALRFGLLHPPALAHRLDRDTSGCLVLGRHAKALRRLGRLFAGGLVEKTYWAVVEGIPDAREGRIDLPLGKRTPKWGWHMAVDPAGQAALTDYRVLGSAGGLAWLELKPRTGRTHQIRVHCAALGCPVHGDKIYGRHGYQGSGDGNASVHRRRDAAQLETPVVPLHLHARAIALPLYPKKPPIAGEAPPPPHMIVALTACGYRPDQGTAPVSTGTDNAAPRSKPVPAR